MKEIEKIDLEDIGIKMVESLKELALAMVMSTGADAFVDNMINSNNEYLSEKESVNGTAYILSVMKGIKKYVLDAVELTDDTKIKWNAHFEIIKKEHSYRLENLLRQEIVKLINEENEKYDKDIRYVIGD